MFSIFLQTATPNTTDYMVAGYVIFFVVMALYLGSLFLRRRNLVQDLEALEEITQSQQEV